MRSTLKRGDKVIIFLLVVFAAFFAFEKYVLSNNKISSVIIRSDGEIIKNIPITNNGEYIIKSKEGELTCIIKDQKVEVVESTCPDKLCMKQGWISKQGESIICLPNRISITIVGGNKAIDSTTY
jgi:hypothetical protein